MYDAFNQFRGLLGGNALQKNPLLERLRALGFLGQNPGQRNAFGFPSAGGPSMMGPPSFIRPHMPPATDPSGQATSGSQNVFSTPLQRPSPVFGGPQRPNPNVFFRGM